MGMIMRDKRNLPLKLEGRSVILREIEPKYFSYIISWRNDKKLNRYLNQPFELTQEAETAWYENKYLSDTSQGYMIMLDKANNEPFGTIGWTDMNFNERTCIQGRILRGNPNYKNSRSFNESFIVMADYLYQYVDVMYAHVVKDNIPSLRLHERLGFKRNTNFFKYPKEQFVLGMEQWEFYRTKEDYGKIRREILVIKNT